MINAAIFYENWFIWSLVLAFGFPLVTILLGVLGSSLETKHPALARVVHQTRNLFVPLLVAFLFIAYGLGTDVDHVASRVSLTAVLICGIAVMLSFVGLVIFGAASPDSWRYKTPKLFRDLVRFVLIAVGIAIVLANVWGQDVAALFTALGVGSIVLGLALQETLGNVMSGIALLIERPFLEGDWISIGDVEGSVKEINWRAIRVINRNGDTVIVPHTGVAKDTITNNSVTNNTVIERVILGFDYDHPPNQVKQMLMDVVASVDSILEDPAPSVHTWEYGDSSISYRTSFFIPHSKLAPEIRDEFLTRVWYASQRNNINIPFPTRTIHHIDETLKGETPLPVMQSGDSSFVLEEVLNSDAFTAASSKLQHFGDKEVVLQQGDQGHEFFIVLSGKAQIVLSQGSYEESLYDLERGDFFGEMSVFSQAAHPYTIIAKGDLEVIALEAGFMQDLIDRRPKLAVDIGQIMDVRRRAIAELFSLEEVSEVYG